MEAQWERKESFVDLDRERAQVLLAPLGIVPLAISLLAEGKANTNYKVETTEGPLVLRIYQRDPGAAALERTILGCLPTGFPTPRIVARGEGLTVFEFCEGKSLERLLIQAERFPPETTARQLARARLALNEKRCAAPGFFAVDSDEPVAHRTEDLAVPSPWSSAVEGHLGWLRHILPHARLDKTLADRIAQVVDDAEPRLQEIAGPPVLTHGDFKPSNLLANEEGLTAVLDWEFAHAGTYLSDVGQILRHPETYPAGFVAAFLDELEFGADAALLARTLDLVNLVDFLSKESDQPTMRRDLERRIAEVAGLYEARFF